MPRRQTTNVVAYIDIFKCINISKACGLGNHGFGFGFVVTQEIWNLHSLVEEVNCWNPLRLNLINTNTAYVYEIPPNSSMSTLTTANSHFPLAYAAASWSLGFKTLHGPHLLKFSNIPISIKINNNWLWVLEDFGIPISWSLDVNYVGVHIICDN